MKDFKINVKFDQRGETLEKLITEFLINNFRQTWKEINVKKNEQRKL